MKHQTQRPGSPSAWAPVKLERDLSGEECERLGTELLQLDELRTVLEAQLIRLFVEACELRHKLTQSGRDMERMQREADELRAERDAAMARERKDRGVA